MSLRDRTDMIRCDLHTPSEMGETDFISVRIELHCKIERIVFDSALSLSANNEIILTCHLIRFLVSYIIFAVMREFSPL